MPFLGLSNVSKRNVVLYWEKEVINVQFSMEYIIRGIPKRTAHFLKMNKRKTVTVFKVIFTEY